jgi:enamine deaminase RidA (YjgF/YER057c/UK114 family)
VTVPAGYATTYISGTSAGSGGFAIPEGADTQAQVAIIYDRFKSWLAAEGLSLGDIVMLRVFLKPDPAKGGKMDTAGANAAFDMFFGTKAQPNKPARITLPAELGGRAMAEIEAVVAHKGK